LNSTLRNEGLLNGMQLTILFHQTLNRHDGLSPNPRSWKDTRVDCLAIKEDGAGPTFSFPTSHFGAFQS